MKKYPEPEVFRPCAARLGEGACWDPLRQSLWWVDIVGRRLFEGEWSGGVTHAWPFDRMIGAVGLIENGGLIGAMHDAVCRIEPDSGRTRQTAAGVHDPRQFRFNDARVDPQGRLWAGTMAFAGKPGQAHLYRMDADHTLHPVLDGVTISNGLAWSPDGEILYYIDSATRSVQAFDFDGPSGTIANRRVVIAFESTLGLPDGCTMDVEGKLWIAHWGGGCVTRCDPENGRLLGSVPVPVRNVSSCIFGGPRLDQLFITTAFPDGPFVGNLQTEPCAGHVFVADVGTTGLPPNRLRDF